MSNDYLPWATASGATPMSQANYLASAERQNGSSPGIADPTIYNKAARQASVVASMVTQFIADTLQVNVVDDGNVAGLETLFEEALTIYASAPGPASLVHGGIDVGTADAMNLNVTPRITNLQEFMFLIVFPAAASTNATAQNPATVTITNTGGNSIVASLFRNDGTPIQAGDYGKGVPVTLVTDGTSWYLTHKTGTNGFHVGDDTGAVNAMVVASNPPITSYAKYNCLVTRPAYTNTGALTVNQDGLGTRAVVRQSGLPLQAGDVLSGAPLVLEDDGTQYRLTGLAQGEVPKIVPAGTTATLYFRSDGTDATADGSSNDANHAFKTLTALQNYAASRFSAAGGTIVAQMGLAGSYAIPASFYPGVGTLVIKGVSSNLAGSILTATTSVCSGIVQVSGVTCVAPSSGGFILAQGGGSFEIDASCALQLSGGYGLNVGPGGTITVNGLGSVSGNGIAPFTVNGNGSLEFGSAAVTFSGTPSYSNAILAATVGNILLTSGASFSGAVSAKSFALDLNATLQRGGVTIPGTAGTNTNGAQYN